MYESVLKVMYLPLEEQPNEELDFDQLRGSPQVLCRFAKSDNVRSRFSLKTSFLEPLVTLVAGKNTIIKLTLNVTSMEI